jgi:hypothetical protein
MKLEFIPHPQPEEEGPPSARAAAREAAPSRTGKRSDPRCRVEEKAFVAIPGLTSRAYDVGEISRGGMFLRFREAHSTLLDFEQNGVETGVSVEVAFAISMPDGSKRFSVRGRISRITRQGIGVQFATHNPPQLAALREVFSGVREESVPGSAASVQKAAEDARVESKRILQKPSEDAAWTNWELLD